MTSKPVLSPPSVCILTLCLSLLSISVCCVSTIPISHGAPAYFTDVNGLAPVPPSYPDIVIKSAYALVTPAAIVPTPFCDTNFTDTKALLFTCFRSYIS